MSGTVNTDERGATDDSINHGIFFSNYGELADPDLLVECSVAAEEAGWDGVFLADHLIDWDATGPDRPIADPWITLAGIASRTERIALGSYVTPAARRQPWQLARDLAILDHLSDGRVIFGAGLGATPDYTTFVESFDPARLAERYDEALDVITGLWGGEPFSYDGTHYTVEEAVLLPTPVQEPRIPILVAGNWPHKKPFHRGARWDGIMPQWPSILRHLPGRTVDELGDHFRDAIDEQQSHEEEVRDLVEYYQSITDDPGDVVFRIDVPDMGPEFRDVCRELGVTWLLSSPVDAAATKAENIEQIRAGPPE